MNRSIRITALYGAILATALLLGACGKQEAPAPANPPASAGTAAAPPIAPASATTATAVPASAASAPAGAATSAAAPAPVAATPLSVAKLSVGDAVDARHQITHPASSFASSDNTLYASVATVGSSGGATLNAKWSYLEGSGQLVSSISQAIATDGPAITTFKVQNPDLWPEGKYRVEISLDGKSVAKQDFEIGKS
jgi:hypothetical protein